MQCTTTSTNAVQGYIGDDHARLYRRVQCTAISTTVVHCTTMPMTAIVHEYIDDCSKRLPTDAVHSYIDDNARLYRKMQCTAISTSTVHEYVGDCRARLYRRMQCTAISTDDCTRSYRRMRCTAIPTTALHEYSDDGDTRLYQRMRCTITLVNAVHGYIDDDVHDDCARLYRR